jgi:hypothetical protein
MPRSNLHRGTVLEAEAGVSVVLVKTMRGLNCTLLAALLAFGSVDLASAREGFWNAIAITPDGAWGIGHSVRAGEAFNESLSSCRRQSGGVLGCGYQSKVIRDGWIMFVRCGRENIIGAGSDPLEAEQRISQRLIELRDEHGVSVGGCLRVVSVSPDGEVEGVPLASAAHPNDGVKRPPLAAACSAWREHISDLINEHRVVGDIEEYALFDFVLQFFAARDTCSSGSSHRGLRMYEAIALARAQRLLSDGPSTDRGGLR